MGELHSLIVANIDWMIIGLLLIEVIAILIMIVASSRQKKMYKKYERLIKGTSGNLEELLFSYVDQVHGVDEKIKAVDQNIRAIREEMRLKLDPAGIVRYNAFQDGGNDLSFSVALLNRNQDGVVLTSLYGREDSRMYAKPVQSGQSTYTLSDEEKNAIEKAVKSVQAESAAAKR